MRPLLIVKLGSTFPRLAQRPGDFEDLIAAGLGELPQAPLVLDGRAQTLPDPRAFSGIILTGSHSMVTERAWWSESAAAWIQRVVGLEVPLLGICYGHQLIAHAMGGAVGDNPNGREFGTVRIRLRAAAGQDPLFKRLGPNILGHTSHTQSVLRLPPGAVRLASTRLDANHAFALRGSAWGVQFHPEYDLLTAQTYIEQCAADIRLDGVDPARLIATLAPTPDARRLLGRFARIAARRDALRARPRN